MVFLRDSMRVFIERKDGPYYPKEFDEQTEIFIDTILIGPERNRIAFFVITKNSNEKLLSNGARSEYHYDANCFIGQRGDNSLWDIRWLKAMNLTSCPTLIDASKRVREMYFILFNQTEDAEEGGLYKHNLDDIRIWDGPVWQQYFAN